MARIVVDPVTRIEGHLRIEANLEGGKITDAWSSGTMFRGIELVLRGRDPREAWIWAQRICGVCTMVHAIASVRAVENALQIEVPENASIVRNLIAGAQMIHDHVVHFYHLHALDWVDVASALKADPAKTSQLAQSISNCEKSSASYFRGVQQRIKGVIDSGQLSLFASGYWGHPAYLLPPEANLLAVAHYLEALTWQSEFIRIHAVLGGKNPHPQSFLVGGMSTAMDPNEPGAVINPETIGLMRDLVRGARKFVEDYYVPDVLAIASFYKDWFTRGEGLGNFLCYGDYASGDRDDPATFLFPRGTPPRLPNPWSMPGTNTPKAAQTTSIPPRARPTPNTPDRKLLTITSMSTPNTRGLRHPATMARRWRWARWPVWWSAMRREVKRSVIAWTEF